MHTYNRAAAGKRIREVRESQGISVRQMAEAIGCTEAEYADMENGYAAMDAERLAALAQAFHISADYIFPVRRPEEEVREVLDALDRLPARERKLALRIAGQLCQAQGAAGGEVPGA